MESVAMTEGSFVTFWNIARAKHPYSDSKFVKKCIVLEYRLYWNPNTKGCPKKKKKHVYAELHKGAYPKSVQKV